MVLLVLLGAALVVPTVQSVRKIQQFDRSEFREGGERRRTALGRWLPTVELVSGGTVQDDPYAVGHWFPLPPAVLIAMSPLTKLHPGVAAALWGGLKIAGVLASFVFLAGPMRKSGFGIPLGVWAVALGLGLRPMIADLQHGNVNLFVLIWCTLSLACYARGKDVLAGLLVSLAVVTKITPGLLLVYFAYKRAWTVCVSAVVGLVAVFFVIPSMIVGFDENLRLLSSWYQLIVAPFVREGYAAGEIANQSLYGVLVRLAEYGGWPATQRMPLQDAMVVGMEEMIRPLGLARWIIRAISVLPLLSTLAWTCRTPKRLRQDPRVLLEFGLILLAMLLLSERTWKHHATALPLVYLGFLYVLTCIPWSVSVRTWHMIGMGLQVLLLIGSSSGIWGETLGDALLRGGVFCWGLVLCFAQLAWLLRDCNRRVATLRSSPGSALT